MVGKVTMEQVSLFEVFSIFASNYHPLKAPYASSARYSTKGLNLTIPTTAITTFCQRQCEKLFSVK
jgi:hypothetical protein